MSNDKSSLRSGLDALFTVSQHDDIAQNEVAVQDIVPGVHQPRILFAEDELEALAQSIKSHGIIQPLILRPSQDKGYEIIAGERRWRAAKMLGLTHVPAIIRNVDHQAAAAFSLIENIQRADLNPLEEAQALHRLLTEFSMTHEEVAQAIGRSRTAVTNILRLLHLCEEVKDYLLLGKIDMGHARALVPLSSEQQIDIANIIIAKQLSVRQTEAFIQKQQANVLQPKHNTLKINPMIKTWEDELSMKLSSKSDIKINSKGAGKIVLSFRSIKNLEEIIKKICDLKP